MGVVNSLDVLGRGSRTTLYWSLAALGLSLAGVVATVAVVLASDQDTSSVRWPLVLVPPVAAALAVAVPWRAVRVALALTLGAWCWAAILSVGVFFLPATVAAAVAAWRGGETT